MLIVLAGSIGRLPVGGHAWVDMQYLLGLKALGHEVVYLEECGPESWVYDWHTQQLTNELDLPANYVRDCIEPVGFTGRWAYRAGDQIAGMSESQLDRMCAEADLFIVRGAPMPQWRDAYFKARRRVFIDSDPAFTQVHVARGNGELVDTVRHCQQHFTIGQRLGEADCPVPTCGLDWIRTVAPIVLDHWSVADPPPNDAPFTTVMQWHSYKSLEHQGVEYGNKNVSFPAFFDLPRHMHAPLLIAMTGRPAQDIEALGWRIVDGHVPSATPASYQRFIQQSRGEFSVAKHGYVNSRCGWFSDRSVCYLATGRPVVVQDTGLADWLDVGEGVVSFDDLTGAATGLDAVCADYDRHAAVARQLAKTMFDANLVLPALLDGEHWPPARSAPG
ncbi:MAG: glycosyltransferase family 1 protein [bacterium]